jgi:hypothetical protein
VTIITGNIFIVINKEVFAEKHFGLLPLALGFFINIFKKEELNQTNFLILHILLHSKDLTL